MLGVSCECILPHSPRPTGRCGRGGKQLKRGHPRWGEAAVAGYANARLSSCEWHLYVANLQISNFRLFFVLGYFIQQKMSGIFCMFKSLKSVWEEKTLNFAISKYIFVACLKILPQDTLKTKKKLQLFIRKNIFSNYYVLDKSFRWKKVIWEIFLCWLIYKQSTCGKWKKKV